MGDPWRFSVATLLVMGWTSVAPAQELTRLQKRTFDRLDANQNGQLEPAELPERWRAAFSNLDLDQNQSISISEYQQLIRNRAAKNSGSSTPSSPAVRETPKPYSYYGSADSVLAIDRIEKLVLKKSQNDQELQLRITFPASGGPYPVIVFSHGLYGSKDNYLTLTEFWASHGYVVVQANHADSRALGTRIGDPQALAAWNERPGDIALIIDSLNSIPDSENRLKGKIDLQRIGVGGHSYGANTTQLIAGAIAKRGRRTFDFSDERVDAALLMSGQGPGEMLTESSWKGLTKPLMVMGGTKDGPTRTGQPAEWRKKPYELSPPGDKYLVWVKELDHGYGDITGAKRLPYNAEHIAYTQAVTLAYWDSYLKQDAAAKSYLKHKQIQHQTDGIVQLDCK